ncbi:FAD-dependent oxidoreductase [Maricaulis parjimensis]|uniref:FAD-dependent oxidoreductase n=1 Tax=Maricaulis parjimensis TaxID=144023 RepID=UPI00193A287A|nr:NAD(P)/FAD-dependent oxidoreductase [Maricaulis parjimensis]
MAALDVAIIGAGPAGITAGLALRRAGLNAKVFERADKVTPLGGAIILNAVGLTILRRLGVDIEDIYNGMRAEFRRWDGRVRARINIDEDLLKRANANGWQSGMMRKELYARMLDKVPDDLIVPQHEFERFEQDEDGVTIHFKNGHVERAKVLVGADGVRSRIRGQLYPDVAPPKPLGIAVWLGWCEAKGIEADCTVIQHDQNFQMGYAPLVFEGKQCFEWWLVEQYKGEAPPENVTQYVKDRIGHFAAPSRDILDQTDHDKQLFRWIVEYIKPLEQWTTGNVTLMGDAAHPTSPYAAYGAGMAIEDAYILAEYLKKADMDDPASIRAGLAKYEDLRRPYTNYTTKFARNLGRIYHSIPGPLRKVRDFMLDNVPGVGRNIETGVTEDAEKLLRQVLDDFD